MGPIERLRNEHRLILLALGCLERLVDAGARQRKLDEVDAARVLVFLRSFADAAHHAKEEDALFPKLIEKGLPAKGGPVSVMLEEHEEGRRLVSEMGEHLDRAAQGAELDMDAFARAGRAFVALLRDHIDKENEVLFPMAERILSQDDAAELANAFDDRDGDREVDAAFDGLGELVERYLPERASELHEYAGALRAAR